MARLVIIDTDIASAFAKIGRLNLLKRLFSEHNIVITPRIRDELVISLQFGYSFPEEIFRQFEVLYPSESESRRYERLISHNPLLGKGEAEAISICRGRKGIFASMDRMALGFAKELGVETLGLHALLRAFWKSQILSRAEIEEIIHEIEEKDNTLIKDANAIFD